MSTDSDSALASAQSAAASASTAANGADFVAAKAIEVNAAKVAAEAARDAARNAGAWTAGEAVTTGSVRQAPDGSRIKSTANRTTRGSFDATEQTFWTAVAATPGTIEYAAQNASTAAAIAGSGYTTGMTPQQAVDQRVALAGGYDGGTF